ncbi:FAD-dependent monooxygenase [Streptomyces sp. NPDC048825]|uniref:FAD-dependent monooxygenase n=1 Tax=Streptomyces sp. NPDC048825 TaxID=3365592 RepID=UPI00371051DB
MDVHVERLSGLLHTAVQAQPRAAGAGPEDEVHDRALALGGFSAPRAEGPPILGVPQSALEETFAARAQEAGAVVLRDNTVCEVRSSERSVRVTALTGDGTRTFDADYVVGCDGARSVVRTQAGFPVTETPATFSGLIGSVRLAEPAAVPDGWTRGEGGWTLINVNPYGHSRVLTHDFSRPLSSRRAAQRAHALPEFLLQRSGSSGPARTTHSSATAGSSPTSIRPRTGACTSPFPRTPRSW